MHRKIAHLLFFGAIAYILLTASSGGRATMVNAGNTGAPLESQLCSNCHNGGSYGSVTLSIQVFQLGTTTPVSAYVPGTAYDMRVTVQNTSGNPAGFGFQMTCLTTPGALPLAGYSNLGANVKQKLVTVGTFNGRTYVEQNGVLPNNQFNFRWTAPASGTGSVRFYASGNAVNGASGSGGDNSGVTSLTLPEQQALSASGSTSGAQCFGSTTGTINLTVTGGQGPYTFLWNDGATTEDRSSLAAGAYSVVITDQSGQQQQLNFTLQQNQPVISSTSSNPALQPGGNGSVGVNTSGQFPPYTYTLGGLSGNSASSSFTISAPAGSYQLCVTDAASCTACQQVVITQPQPLQANATISQVTCAGLSNGSVTLSPQGATPPYSYAWSTGDTDNTLSGVAGGSYTVTITDVTGYAITNTFTVAEPAPLQVTTEAGAIPCAWGTTEVQVMGDGGTPPYSGAGTLTLGAGEYEIQLSDQNGCSATQTLILQQPAPFQPSSTSAVLPCEGGEVQIDISATGGTPPYTGTGPQTINFAGEYIFTLSDANACQAILITTISAESGIEATGTSQPAGCPGECSGSAVVVVENANGAFTVEWTDGTTGLQRNELCAGIYNYTLTDADGCTLIGSILVEEPEPFTTIFEAQTILCAGEAVPLEAVITGGTPPYAVSWNTGSSDNPLLAQAGEYELLITDAQDCSSAATWTLTEPDPLVLTVDSFVQSGAEAGFVDITVSGGTPPYTYAWTTGSNLEDELLPPNTAHSVTATDSNGCTIQSEELEFIVSVPEAAEGVLSVYPNPARNYLVIQSAPGMVIGQLRLYDAAGSLVLDRDADATTIRVDLTAYPSGLYTLGIRAGDNWAVKRISLER